MCFRIHEHNVEDLILCALPYHDTDHFVRVVQILKIGLEIYDCLLFSLLLCLVALSIGMVYDVFIGLCQGMVHGGFLRVSKTRVQHFLERL